MRLEVREGIDGERGSHAPERSKTAHGTRDEGYTADERDRQPTVGDDERPLDGLPRECLVSPDRRLDVGGEYGHGRAENLHGTPFASAYG